MNTPLLRKSLFRFEMMLNNESVHNLFRFHMTNQYTNSEGREEMHSLLDKLAETLQTMSYQNFMIWLRVFFAVRNLISMGLN